MKFRYPSPPRFSRSGPGLIAVLLLCAAMMTGPGCTRLGSQPEKQTNTQAEDIIKRIQSINAQVLTSRGTGELTLNQGPKNEKYKIAWAAQSPNRLRMTLLMSGYPVETIASSGKWVTFVSHTGTHPPHSAVSSDPDLEPYINIPLHLSELVSLLLGKVPQRPFDQAWILPYKSDTVFASQSFFSEIQEFFMDETGRTARYRVLDKKMNMIFGIWYSQFFICDKFSVPGVITVKDKHLRSMEISLKNLTLNIPVKESLFRLTGS